MVDDQINSLSIEQFVHLSIADVIDDCHKRHVLVQNQEQFEQIINELVDGIFEKFQARYKRIKNEEKFKNTFLGILRIKQDKLLIGSEFGDAYREVRYIDEDSDNDQRFFEAILIYNKHKEIKDNKPLIDYLADVRGLLIVYDKIRTYSLSKNQKMLPEDEYASSEQREEKTNLEMIFIEYGFFDLPKVKCLSMAGNEKLVKLIAGNKLPYQIAMLDFLGFVDFLERAHFSSKYKIYKEMAQWLNSSKDGRSIKGNLSSLLPLTTENKHRYTVCKFMERVKNDYVGLK